MSVSRPDPARAALRGAQRFAADERGFGAVKMLFATLALVVVCGLSLDYASAVRTQSRLQAVADTAALAGAMRLPRTDRALAEALAVSARNTNAAAEGTQLAGADIEFGRWSELNRTFTVGAARPNAVRLLVRRDSTRENAVATLLMRLVGVETLDLTASAMAVRIVRLCGGSGFFAAQRLTVTNTNHFRNGFCLHGEPGVTLNNNTVFEIGTTVSMLDRATFVEGNNSVGTQEALIDYSHTFTVPDDVWPTIQAMRDGDLSVLPSFITRGPVFVNQINANQNLVPGTLYVVRGNARLGSNRTLTDVAIVAAGTIEVISNTYMDRVVFASEGGISFNSNNWIGTQLGDAEDICAAGTYSSYMLSMGNITMNSASTLRGVLMGAQGDIMLGNNNGFIDGVTAEALGRIEYGNANRSWGCPTMNADLDTVQPAGMGGSNLIQ